MEKIIILHSEININYSMGITSLLTNILNTYTHKFNDVKLYYLTTINMYNHNVYRNIIDLNQ